MKDEYSPVLTPEEVRTIREENYVQLRGGAVLLAEECLRDARKILGHNSGEILSPIPEHSVVMLATALMAARKNEGLLP